MELSDFTFTSLDKETILHHFDCDDADINEFLHEDALNYQLQKIANTYLFLDDKGEIVAFFSISNDCLNDLGEVKDILIQYGIGCTERYFYQMKSG